MPPDGPSRKSPSTPAEPRRKVPRLGREDDLWQMFGVSPAGRADQSFEELVEESLTRPDLARTLQEKEAEAAADSAGALSVERYPAPQAEIDLHGHTTREAASMARAFLERSRHQGLATVRLIVGKGLHSEGRAVLPDFMERTLAAFRQEGLVLTFRWEKAEKRRSGSLIAYLPRPTYPGRTVSGK